MMIHRHFERQRTEPEPKKAKKPIRKRRSRPAGEKTAVFIATRNWYDNMIVSVKSLFCNSDVDRVVLVVEDDEFPVPIPKEVEIINGSDFEFFDRNSPNMSSHFSGLCVSRAAYGYILNDLDRVLSLDSDLVAVDDISGLWSTELDGNYCAGVLDMGISRPGYINAGVVLMDLKKLRDDGITDRMIDLLNRQRRDWIDQDALNECCDGKILLLPTRYNESPVTGRTEHPAIVHYVGVSKTSGSNGQHRHYWDEYAKMSWDDVSKLRAERYGKPLTF